jgi:hypothetical protein
MDDQKNFAGKFHLWFNLIMIAVYILLGILLLFTLQFDSLPSLNTKMMGGVLLLYAAYRGYKLYKTYSVRPQGNQTNANR